MCVLVCSCVFLCVLVCSCVFLCVLVCSCVLLFAVVCFCVLLCVVVCCCVVFLTLLDEHAMCMSTRRGDAMQPGIAHVPSHLGVKLAAAPPRPPTVVGRRRLNKS